MTAGVRYDEDAEIRTQYTLDPNTLAVVGVLGGGGTPEGKGYWNSTSYTIGLQYHLNPRTMLYLTNSKGYSAGGLQNLAGHYEFQPDHLNNLEAGVKSTFPVGNDWMMRVDTSGYYGFFTDVQVQSIVFNYIPGTTVRTFVPTETNAASARVTGFDMRVDAAFRNELLLDAWVSHIDDYYTNYNSLNPVTGQPVDLSSSPFLLTPPWKVGLSATYHLPIDRDRFGDISVNANYIYRSQMWINLGKPIVPTNPNDPNTGALCYQRRTLANGYPAMVADNGIAGKDCTPSWYNLNLGLTWEDFMGKPGVKVGLRVTNVTNNPTPPGIGTAYDSLGFTSEVVNPPRFVYATLGYTF